MILSYLIQTSCQESYLAELTTKKWPAEIQKFHRSCPKECLLKDFAGEADWLPVFSFGEFNADFARSLQHRVGIDREHRTVAVGKIVSIEVVPEGTDFQFRVILPVPALNQRTALERAVRGVGQWLGLGHYKSLGFGRFEVRGVSETSLKQEIERASTEASKLRSPFRLTLETPMVIQNATYQLPLQTEALGQSLAQALFERTTEVSKRFELATPLVTVPILPENCRFSFRPDYVSRESFEEGMRKNALVALRESWFDVSFEEITQPLWQQLAVARVLGVGPWADAGFGRLSAQNPTFTGG
jgi:hypothetical protein